MAPIAPSGNNIGSFQTRVNLYNPLGVAGDFASANPRATALTIAGGFVAGPEGVTIGKFAWIGADGRTVTNQGQTSVQPDGFVHRDQQGDLTDYLQAAGTLIPPGFPVTLMVAGDFFANNGGPSSLVRGGTVYASYEDGSVETSAGTAGSVTATLGSTNTASLGSTNTASLGATFTASADIGDATRLVVTAVTGYIAIGDVVSGSGITPGTTILSQDSGGTPNGAGTYVLSAVNTASSATITCFGSTIDVTVSAGLISIGDTVSGGSGFPVGATIQSFVSGTEGGVGVYTLSAPGTAYTASAASVTTFGNVVKITAVSTYISIGDRITGGAGFPSAATTVTGFISGTLGVAGVYTISNRGTAYTASATGVLTFGLTVAVTAIGSGTFSPGQPVVDATTGGNIPSGAVIESQISGLPGLTGVYTISPSATTYAAGDNLTTTAGIELTKWKAQSAAGVGELVQISTW